MASTPPSPEEASRSSSASARAAAGRSSQARLLNDHGLDLLQLIKDSTQTLALPLALGARLPRKAILALPGGEACEVYLLLDPG